MAQDFSTLRKHLGRMGLKNSTNKSLVSLVNYIIKNYSVLEPISYNQKRRILLAAFEVCKKYHESIKHTRNKNALLVPDDLLKNTRTEAVVLGIKLISYYLYYEENLPYSDIALITNKKISKVWHNVLSARDYILDEKDNYIKTMYADFLTNLNKKRSWHKKPKNSLPN